MGSLKYTEMHKIGNHVLANIINNKKLAPWLLKLEIFGPMQAGQGEGHLNL